MIEMFKPSRVAGLAVALATLFGAAGLSQPAWAEGGEQPTRQQWSFAGPFGRYDQGQLQRGFKVYREVCSACHSMDLVYFRNLGQAGGPFYDPKYPNPNDNPYVKSLAKDIQVSDIDSDTGDAIKNANGSVQNSKGPLNFHREVNVSRCVDNIDAVLDAISRPETGSCSRCNCNTALLFLLHPIHRRGSLMNLADLVRNTGVEKHTLSRRGFTRVDMGHDADVSKFV